MRDTAQQLTQSVWPFNVFVHAPLSTSQIFSVLYDPLKTHFPSRDTAQQRTLFVWPFGIIYTTG